jgi:hypothetical protein
MTMNRLKCLLLDANVVLELFSMGLWDVVAQRWDLHVAETVLNEAKFFFDQNGQSHSINWELYRTQIGVFQLSVGDIAAFRALFDRSYLDRLDPGETESLAYLFSPEGESFVICSADAIVFRVLGNKQCTERGISLESILDKLGTKRRVDYQYTEKFRRKYNQIGLGESLFKL